MENVTRVMVSPDMNFYDAVTHNLVEMISNPMNQMVFITIYRCNKKSPIITALIKATKQIPVFVYVEPKASGMHDENRSLAKYLKKEGCHVLCGMKDIPNKTMYDRLRIRRVHFKACLCIADEATEAFYSTGNFILPQRNHAEDFSVRISIKDDPNIIRHLGLTFDTIFDLKSIYPDIFKKMTKTIYPTEGQDEKFAYPNIELTPSRVHNYMLNVLNSYAYWYFIYDISKYSMDQSGKVDIRIKTRNIGGKCFSDFVELLKNYIQGNYGEDALKNLHMSIIVRDYISDEAKDTLEKYDFIEMYSGAPYTGYSWHGGYATINDVAVLPSCDTCVWEGRYEIALVIPKHVLQKSVIDNGTDTLQNKFDHEKSLLFKV